MSAVPAARPTTAGAQTSLLELAMLLLAVLWMHPFLSMLVHAAGRPPLALWPVVGLVLLPRVLGGAAERLRLG